MTRWFKTGFWSDFWDFSIHNMQKIFFHGVRFNPHEVRLNQHQKTQKNLENSKSWKTRKIGIFQVFLCSAQSEVKKIILIKSSLGEVRLMRLEIYKSPK